MPDAALTQAAEFRIQILEGSSAGTNLNLAGRALPYRGVEWTTKQRGKTTYYPGNVVATQQLMGPVDQPFTIKGMWKDTFLGNGAARQLCNTFDAVCRSGFAVQVSWGETQYGEPAIVREGYISEFKQNYDRVQDVAWEITFEPRGRGIETQPPLTSATFVSSKDGFDNCVVAFDDVVSINTAFRESFLTRLAGLPQVVEKGLDALQNTLTDGIISLEKATAVLSENSDIPGSTLERARGVAAHGASAINGVRDLYLGLDLALLLPTNAALAFLDLLNTLFGVFKTCDESAEIATNLDTSLARQQRPPVLAEIAVTPGTDLRDVATKYYGNPDLWYFIADYNGLSSSKMPDMPTGPSDMATSASAGGVPAYTIKIPQQTAGVMGVTTPEC